MQGLPPDAATWRKDRFPPQVEFAALAVERLDGLIALRTAKPGSRVRFPGAAGIERPGEAEREKQVISDPGEVRAFFARHGGAKHVGRR